MIGNLVEEFLQPHLIERRIEVLLGRFGTEVELFLGTGAWRLLETLVVLLPGTGFGKQTLELLMEQSFVHFVQKKQILTVETKLESDLERQIVVEVLVAVAEGFAAVAVAAE